MRTFVEISQCLLAVLLLVSCGGPTSGAQPPASDCRQTVNDDLSVPTTLVNGPEECDYFFPGGDVATYRVTSDVRVEPGAVLRFGVNALVLVDDQGSLTAVGEPGARITFEGAEAVDGYWYGICFAVNRESRLGHVDVRWAGAQWTPAGTACRGGIAGMYPGGDAVHIEDTTVSGSYVSGLSVHDLTLGDFADNAFFGNREYGATVDASQVRKLDVGTDYLGSDSGAANGKPYVYAGGHVSDPDSPHIWSSLNAPYFASDEEDYPRHITAADGTTLVIDQGTTIVFDGDSELYVYGGAAIALGGTAENRVVLRGLDEVRGSWKGLTISNGAAILNYVDILWGGRDDIYAGSLAFVEVGTDVNGKELRDVFINGSANCALRIWHGDDSLFDPLDVNYGADNEADRC